MPCLGRSFCCLEKSAVAEARAMCATSGVCAYIGIPVTFFFRTCLLPSRFFFCVPTNIFLDLLTSGGRYFMIARSCSMVYEEGDFVICTTSRVF